MENEEEDSGSDLDTDYANDEDDSDGDSSSRDQTSLPTYMKVSVEAEFLCCFTQDLDSYNVDS